MTERKFVYQNDGAIKRTMVWEDDEPETVRVYTEQDLTQALENNKIMRELHPRRSTNKLVARGVPVAVYEKSVLEGWDSKDWARWLDDPDNAAFRIWRGRVGK
jgi:hypothetical protein